MACQKNGRFWISFFLFCNNKCYFFSFVEEDKKLLRECRKLLEITPQIANMFDPMWSQTIIEMLNLFDPPENMEA